MHKSLETYDLPKTKSGERENINRPIASNDIVSVIQNSQQSEIKDQTTSQVYSTKHLKSYYLSFPNSG